MIESTHSFEHASHPMLWDHLTRLQLPSYEAYILVQVSGGVVNSAGDTQFAATSAKLMQFVRDCKRYFTCVLPNVQFLVNQRAVRVTWLVFIVVFSECDVIRSP
jgi:hypothetical protein